MIIIIAVSLFLLLAVLLVFWLETFHKTNTNRNVKIYCVALLTVMGILLTYALMMAWGFWVV